MHSSQRLLVDYDMSMLRALAENRGVELATNRQTEAADQLAAALLEPLSVRVALAQLSNQGREALDAILARGGRMRAPQFARSSGQIRPIGPGRLEREAPWKEPASPAEELLYLGLVFRAFSADEGGPGEFVFVPADLIPLLPVPQHVLSRFTVEKVHAPDQARLGESDLGALVLDLFTYLVFIQNQKVRLHADGRPGRNDLSALRAKLIDPDDRRLAFLRHLAERLGFVTAQERNLRLQAAPVRRWLALPCQAQLAVLQETWRDDPIWDDLCVVPGLMCDSKTDWLRRRDPTPPRHALLALLARCPTDGWWSAGSFVAAVKDFHPDFQRPDGDYSSWYIRDVTTDDYLSGFDSWDRVEAAYIIDLLSGPLKWLRVVLTAEGDGDFVCRLTEAGARFLDLLPAGREVPPPLSIVVDSGFGVTVPAPINLYARFQLERFAELESTTPCRYRLTTGSIWHALARGIEVEQVVAFLQQAHEGALPANVVGRLRLWAGRYDRVALEEVTLLRARDERAIKELSVLPETRSLLETVLSPTLALIRKRDLPRLQKELRALGYLPPISAESGDDGAKRG